MANFTTAKTDRPLFCFRLYLGLALFLLFSARSELLTDAALFLLLPLTAALLLLGRDRAHSPLAPFLKENRNFLPAALFFTLLFFVQLPLWDLLKSPLFSEEGLCAIIWDYRILRLAFLCWNFLGLLPAALYSAFYCLYRLLRLFLSPGEASSLRLPEDRKCHPRLPSAAGWILIVCAVICLISTLPSSFDADTDTVWYNSVRGNFSDWHPVTYRFFVKLCSMVHYSRFTVTFVQTLLFIGVGLACISLLSRLDRRGGTAFVLLTGLLFTPFFSLQDMNKDVAFSAALVGLTLSVINLMTLEQIRLRDVLALGLFGYLILSFRHAGILPLMGAVIPLLAFGFKQRRALIPRTLIASGCALILYILIAKVLAFGVLHAIPNPGYIKYGTPMSMVAASLKEGVELTEEEQALLTQVMPLEKWEACFTKYYPGTLSRKYSLVGEDIEKVETLGVGPDITLLAGKLIFRCPQGALATLFDNASILWTLSCPADQKEIARFTYALTDHALPTEQESYTGASALTFRLSELYYQTPVLHSFSLRGGPSLFLLLFSGYVLLKKRRPEAWALLPAAFLTAGLFISVPSPSTRYALPLMQVLTLMLPYALLVPMQEKKEKNPLN